MDGLGTGCRNSSHKSLNRSLKRVDSLKRLGDYKLSKPTNGIEGYFLILDVLTEVLSDRLIRERSDKFRTKQPKEKFRRQEAMYARIEHTVTGIVDGMRYLHSLDIVLRDLKSGNVGFDEDMNVRLFDFGMARRVSECVQDEICGSPRYMAPEIMEGKGYTLKVDVYSFGILMYELCTLEVPFANSCALMKQKQRRKKKMFDFRSIFERNPLASKNATAFNDDDDDDSCNCGVKSPHANPLIEFYKKVVFDELRPSNNNLESVIPCPQISKLIKECWSADPDTRPSFDEIATRLEAIFNSNHTKRTKTQYCH
jgi:serine/threonine protein kinase